MDTTAIVRGAFCSFIAFLIVQKATKGQLVPTEQKLVLDAHRRPRHWPTWLLNECWPLRERDVVLASLKTAKWAGGIMYTTATPTSFLLLFLFLFSAAKGQLVPTVWDKAKSYGDRRSLMAPWHLPTGPVNRCWSPKEGDVVSASSKKEFNLHSHNGSKHSSSCQVDFWDSGGDFSCWYSLIRLMITTIEK